jgi:hypothetical protein
MSYSPLAIKRRYVLGDIYKHCSTVESIPVYMNEVSDEALGFVDESLGIYADAFLFHLPEDICKRLSTGHYNYSFDYDVSYDQTDKKKRFKLNFILLVAKKAPPSSRLSQSSIL